MPDPLKKILEPIKDLQTIRGVQLPIGLEFLQLVVTGPPGAGKSYYIEQIKGWPNEGYLDLTKHGWWKNQSLIYRPREVHLGLPFKGIKEALTVFDKEWLKTDPPLELELNRIVLPPVKKYFFQTNWHNRYIFEFLIPRPSTIYQQRLARQEQGYFPVDDNLSLEMVRQQVAIYREVALYLHRAGLNVYLRKGLDNPPLFFAEPGIASVPRWTLDKIPQKPGLNTLAGWKYLFRRKYPIEWITVTNIPQKIQQVSRIAHNGRSIGLYLGTKELRFNPEIALGVKKNIAHKNWIINTETSCSTKKIRGFIRLKVGETIVIGRSNPEFIELFDLDDSVGLRHLSVTNRKGDLILTPLSTEYSTEVLLLNDLDLRERLERGRHKALLKIRRIYGQEIVPLPSKMALDSIRAVNTLLKHEPFRPENDQGVAGGLIELTSQSAPVIVGDLHAQVDNFLKILSENCLLDCLRLKTATLIILGDAVHSENAHEMDKFETSMLIMDLIIRLKLTFPENFFYLRGNHDSFSPEINKNGFLQGELFREYLTEHRGEEYVEEMTHFYNNLAYVVCSTDYLCCHAGPPRSKVTRAEIINMTSDSPLIKEMTQNRLQRSNHLGGYNKSDVKQFRKALEIAPKATFFVGHTPMDPFGSYWLNAGNIKNHHVIYSAHDDGPSIFIRTAHRFMPISFPAEPLTEFINDLN
ncbi:metallophosphoesterase [Desulforhopalus sp. IMCC35007]|uniref:metallophosphoesterase n=1 Tax=Desulforhopalus sp. IMCC35007 TaxID=2569543 RepID=UPI0010AE342A|nr:metallophosphoesterase [Desulforhopalus sp. IMCC35007]TKB10652.1 serine/threonine protein phosphatase [Desulforhopalus sp. IMCC35007]